MALSTIEKIQDCIKNRKSFILDAGAGSGKTWTLIETLKYVINSEDKLSNNNQKIVCITYTNIAKDEIKERLEYNENIDVYTIHDFLWNCISQFKIELKEQLLELIDEKIIKNEKDMSAISNHNTAKYIDLTTKQIKLNDEKEGLNNTVNKTQYMNFPLYKENIISHDEVIEISLKMFSAYPNLKKLVTDRYPFIFVDEYQDTFQEVIKILLDILYPTNKTVIGFFGDKMQKIYEKGVGEIPITYNLIKITKNENYRCSVGIINILNKIRDDIKQIPTGKNKEIKGNSFFYKGQNQNFNLNEFIENHVKEKVNLKEDRSNLKVLYLTHRSISKEGKYEELYELINQYGKVDALIKKDLDRCIFIKTLYDIEEIVRLYQEGKIQMLLKKISFEINSFEDIDKINEILTELSGNRENKKIEEILSYVFEKKLIKRHIKIENYNMEDEKKRAYYDALLNINYKQIMYADKMSEENSPFSTKHGTKGAEYENVIVAIDDSSWNQYNFDNYFSNDKSNENRYNRTQNLFYVVCSRAEINLFVVMLSNVSTKSEVKIKEMFGEIIEI